MRQTSLSFHLAGTLLSLFIFSASGAMAGNAKMCAKLFLTATNSENTNLQIDLTPSIQNLSSLRLDLDIAKSHGINSIEFTALAADYQKKEQELIQYLEEHQIMTQSQLLERMRQEIELLQSKNQQDRTLETEKKEEETRRREAQEKIIKDSLIDGTEAVLHRIEPGSFKMGPKGEKVDVTITKPFAMMATPTTQIIWKAVAELANKKLKYQLQADPSELKADNRPVEKVSYDEIQLWLKALNELSQAGEPALEKIIRGHKNGDVYRLPTEAEWEFVGRGRGKYNGTTPLGMKNSQIDAYAWYEANSGGKPQPVAQKLPLVIDGKEFYDMYGNIWHWVQNRYEDVPSGGMDPKGPRKGPHRVIRGGGYFSKVLDLSMRNGYGPTFASPSTGFRFVREIP